MNLIHMKQSVVIGENRIFKLDDCYVDHWAECQALELRLRNRFYRVETGEESCYRRFSHGFLYTRKKSTK